MSAAPGGVQRPKANSSWEAHGQSPLFAPTINKHLFSSRTISFIAVLALATGYWAGTLSASWNKYQFVKQELSILDAISASCFPAKKGDRDA